jgi:glycosyltransferase involved in cell wall biosynthesis
MTTSTPDISKVSVGTNTSVWADLRICFVSNCRRMGGAERVLLETIDVLTGKGIKCMVLVPGEGEFAKELSRKGIVHKIARSTSLSMSGKPSAWERCKAAVRFVIAVASAMRYMVTWRCDVVFSNTVTVGHGAVAAKILSKPHIWHLHEFGREDHGFGFYFGERLSCRIVGSLSRVCIVVSKALAKKYRGLINPTKLIVLYPSMHLDLDERIPPALDRSLGVNDGSFRCIIVGGVFAGKRQEDAVLAFNLLKEQDFDGQLFVVGASDDLEYRAKLDRMIGDLSLQDRVIFTGEVRDARPLIQTSDVLIVCSRSEAFGRVTIEAMLAGKPVIGASAGATPELVQDKFNGLIYEVGNPAALAEKMLYLYRHPGVAHDLGENGKHWASSVFTVARYSEELDSILGLIPETANQNR